jgi:hypothetical protein
MGGDIVNHPIDEAKEDAIRREERERIIKILLRNQFCFMDEVDCPGHSNANCEACARKALEKRE